jgi:sugar-specific transcriptional regulator TrmB
MKKEEIVEKMGILGISRREANIYLALLEKGELTAMEIHELTGVPRTKVYETTQRMVIHGMCIEKTVDQKKIYQAIEPARTFDNIVKIYRKEHEQDLDRKEQLAQDISRAIMPSRLPPERNVDITEHLEVISGASSIQERFISLVKHTKFELLGLVKEPFVHQNMRDKLQDQHDPEFAILKKGVKVRMVYEIPSRKQAAATYQHIKKCVQAGENARVLDHVPLKLFVVDRKYTLVALASHKQALSPVTMIGNEHPDVAATAKMFFEYMWNQAQDYQILWLSTMKRKHGKGSHR